MTAFLNSVQASAGARWSCRLLALKKKNSEVGKASAAGHNLPNQTWIGPMTKTLGILTVVSLLCMPLHTHAQGTSQQNGTRNGYVGTGSPGMTSISTPNSPAGSPSRNAAGTGQSRSEGAYGLTPQLQKELGIGRQQ
jgi:hypothetical protein